MSGNGATRMKDNADYACKIGATTDGSDLTAAKQKTHDELIQQLGIRRLGPVQWIVVPPGPERVRAINEFCDDSERANVQKWFEAHPNGWFVCAFAEAIK